MSESKEPKQLPGREGIFNDLLNRVKLVVRLMADRRVHPLLKLLPVGSLAYLLIPDIAPGPIDDALVIWLGTSLFVELCPAQVVQEHVDALQRVIPGTWRDVTSEVKQSSASESGEIIDADFKEEKS